MRSLGLDKLSNAQIFQLQISLFLAVKRPSRPLRFRFGRFIIYSKREWYLQGILNWKNMKSFSSSPFLSPYFRIFLFSYFLILVFLYFCIFVFLYFRIFVYSKTGTFALKDCVCGERGWWGNVTLFGAVRPPWFASIGTQSTPTGQAMNWGGIQSSTGREPVKKIFMPKSPELHL